MAIALVGSITHKARTSVASGASTTVTRTGVTAGSALILPVAWFNDGEGSGMVISDDRGNTWTIFSNSPASGDTRSHIAIFHALNVAAGDTIITINPADTGGSGSVVEADVLEFSGVMTSSAVDVVPADASGTGTSVAIVTGTLAQADEVVVMINAHTGADLTTMDHDTADGFTEISQQLDNDSGQTYESQYKITAATTSLTINCTYDASRTWFATAASLKGLAAAGSSSVSPSVSPSASVSPSSSESPSVSPSSSVSLSVSPSASVSPSSSVSLSVSPSASVSPSSSTSASPSPSDGGTVVMHRSMTVYTSSKWR